MPVRKAISSQNEKIEMIERKSAIERRIAIMAEIGWTYDPANPIQSYRECLSSLYLTSGLSQNCIGHIFDMIPETVRQDLVKLGITVRRRRKTGTTLPKDPGKPGNNPEDMSKAERRAYLIRRAKYFGVYRYNSPLPENLSLISAYPYDEEPLDLKER